tara:strand:+ start:430 stop:966 length:537 start_codon:yes stop_codon:yes gene_type:complete
MALVVKAGVDLLGEETLTSNVNFLSPLGFRFVLNRAPNIEYFCQAVTLPTISMTEVVQGNPLANIYQPGDRIQYEPLQVTFRVDENMSNYLEIHDWVIGLGHPDKLKQYADLVKKSSTISDGAIMILSSNQNPKIRVNFEDLFPISLSPLRFDVTQTDVEYLEAEVSFRYRKFNIENL